MCELAKDIRPKTVCDWIGVFFLLGSILATIGLTCFGIVNIWKKGLNREALDAFLSILKLLGLNCGLLLASLAILYFSHRNVLGIIVIAQHLLIFVYALLFESGFFPRLGKARKSWFITFALPFVIRLIVMLAGWSRKRTMPFVKRAVSKGVTWRLLLCYVLAVIFIATAAFGMLGLFASPATDSWKAAAALVGCNTILLLAIAARLLRVLHAAKIVQSRGLLESLQSSKVTAFVISRHLGSLYFHYLVHCMPLLGLAFLFTLSGGWRIATIITNPFTTFVITLFPIYDAVCGTRMLIRKKNIWKESLASVVLYNAVPACSMPITLLQNTGLISSFGALFLARAFKLRLFGSAQAFAPYSILTCTVMHLASQILYANMAADAPTQIGIYLNAPQAVNVSEIPESEFASAVCDMCRF